MAAPEVIIRPGSGADARQAADLWLRARRAAFAQGTIPPVAASDDDVRTWFSSEVAARLDLWLAESPEGELLGLMVLDGEWLSQLYVDPAHTGRGIGSQFVELAKRERPAGLRLWAFQSNTGARRFYERHGFADVLYTDGAENIERAPDVQYAYPSP